MNKAAVEFVTKLVNEKHTRLKSSIESFLQVVAREDKEQKKKAIEQIQKNLLSLLEVVPQEGRPQWIGTLNSVYSTFNKNVDTAQYLKQLLKFYNDIVNHNWRFDNPAEIGCDFDAIFRKYKAESRLNELFDSITTILEQMVADGHIDSIRILDQLKKIIATIKKNKNGSYFSMMGTWNFFVHFMKNVLWDELTKIPLLGSLLKTLAEVTDEVDKELELVHKQVGEEVEKEFNTPLQSITYSSTAKLLPTTSITFEATA